MANLRLVLGGVAPHAKAGERGGAGAGGSREDLTPIFAHDLRSPLSAISMNLDFAMAELEERGKPAAGVVAALEDGRAAVTRAFRIISDMIAIAGFDSGALEPVRDSVDTSAMVDGVLRAMGAEAAGRGVQLAREGEGAPLAVDAELLGGALADLVDRAVQVTRSGGRVVVRIGGGPEDVVFDVLAGAPLAPGDAATAFARPSRRDRSRASLALYSARIAVEAQGGTIALRAEGAFAGGARITLPRTDGISPSAPRLRR